MKYTHLSLCLFLAVGSIIYGSNAEEDPFSAGKVYDKDGSRIYIERPWFRPNDIIINQWYGNRRARTTFCTMFTLVSAFGSGYIAYYTFQGKRYYKGNYSAPPIPTTTFYHPLAQKKFEVIPKR